MPLTLKWQHPTCSCIAWTVHQPTQTSCQELQNLSLFPDSDREPQASEAAAWPQVVWPGSLQAPSWLFQSAKEHQPSWLQSVKNSPLTRKCPTTSDNAWDFLTEAWKTEKGFGGQSEGESRTFVTEQTWEVTRNRLFVKVLTSWKSYQACVLSCSVMSDSLSPFGLITHQAPLSMGFFRQEYWSGCHFPPLGDLPDPRIEPKSPVSPALQVTSHGESNHTGSARFRLFWSIWHHDSVYT